MDPRPETRIGVLLLENKPLDLPGAMASEATFPGALRRIVPGADGNLVLGPDFGEAQAGYVETARRLADDGASLLTANCGFAVAYQDAVAAQGCPTALSSLLLLPLLWRVFGGDVGVLTYDAAQLDDARRQATGWPSDRVPVADVRALSAWEPVNRQIPVVDAPAMEKQLIDVAVRFARANDLRALLLECTAMFPFTDVVREAVGMPTFDLNSFVRYLAEQLPGGRATTTEHG